MDSHGLTWPQPNKREGIKAAWGRAACAKPKHHISRLECCVGAAGGGRFGCYGREHAYMHACVLGHCMHECPAPACMRARPLHACVLFRAQRCDQAVDCNAALWLHGGCSCMHACMLGHCALGQAHRYTHVKAALFAAHTQHTHSTHGQGVFSEHCQLVRACIRMQIYWSAFT